MTVRAVPGGVLVEVRVRPRSRPGWQITAGALVIRVAGPPVGGAATEEARPRARQGPRRGAQPGVPATRRALPHEGVRGRRCRRRGGEGGAQEGRERSPGSWWSWSSCLKSSSSMRRDPRPTSVRQVRRIVLRRPWSKILKGAVLKCFLPATHPPWVGG